MESLEWMVLGNPLRLWLVAVLAGVALVALLTLVSRAISHHFRSFAARTETHVDDVVAAAVSATRLWFFAVLGLWAASMVLEVTPSAQRFIVTLTVVAAVIQAGIWGGTAVQTWVGLYRERHLEEDAASVTTIVAVGFLLRVAIWSVILLVALDNVGVDVTAMIAGLGVGGIAIALAIQNILGDLFASLSIVLDKPFVVGDFIIVGDLLGTVEHIGLKTTRVRSLSGEQLVFSNSDLLSSRIRNFKRMFERRVVFGFGVVYQTPHEDLQRIPGMVREIVEAQPETRFDRAHFKEFGDSSLDFEVVYYVLVPDYNSYMDIQQAINLEIYRRFEEGGIDFAYPTRTLYLRGEGNGVLARGERGAGSVAPGARGTEAAAGGSARPAGSVESAESAGAGR